MESSIEQRLTALAVLEQQVEIVDTLPIIMTGSARSRNARCWHADAAMSLMARLRMRY